MKRHTHQYTIAPSILAAAALVSVSPLLPMPTTLGSLEFGLSSATAQVIDIGGEKFKGGGDKKKPKCQISHPLSANSSFFIEWNCEDDTAEPSEIQTQVWILRPDAPRYVIADEYLGFPASLEVTEELLGGPFTEWLPASFVLLARDTAGNTAISSPFTITNRDNDVDTCNLVVSTRATESDGETTGVPNLTAALNSVSVFTQSTNNSTFTVKMFRPEIAEPCDIDEICSQGSGDPELFFTASITVNEQGDAEGRINLDPGEFSVNVTGSSTLNESTLEDVQLTGTTIIDNVVTDVDLDCSQSGSGSSSSSTSSSFSTTTSSTSTTSSSTSSSSSSSSSTTSSSAALQ
jgi:hypothetical protein